MLQKILVILVGLVMSLVGALSPDGLLAAQEGTKDPFDLAGASVRSETLATVRTSDQSAFARIPVLWAEVDGKRIVEDAWGTGEVKELRFKVGVKGAENVALLVGERQVPVQPTDVLTVRMFHGDFSFRGMGTPQSTLQLQGEVKTTTLAKGSSPNRVVTSVGEAAGEAPELPADGRVAYVVLTTGQKLDTVAVESGGERVYTEESAAPDAPGNILATWVKVNGKLVREYTWGEGMLDTVEFEAADATVPVTLTFGDASVALQGGVRATVKDFVGEYLIYQVNGEQVRLRLDGYAADVADGVRPAPPVGVSGPGAPVAAFEFFPANPKTTDVVRFRDLSVDDGGDIVLRTWEFGDGVTDVRKDPTHRFDKPGVYEVSLSVTDLDVVTSRVTRTVTVRNAEPGADFDFQPKRVQSGGIVAFTDLSRDADGAVLNWTWDFGDGETSHARHPVHRFTKGGNHTVTLTVVDDLSGVAVSARSIVVINTPPTPRFTFSPDLPASQSPVQFFDNSSDADGRVVAWEWSFGDGGKAIGPTPTHSFRQPGPHVVTLTVTDDAGGAATMSQTLLVQNRAPRADFLWSPMNQPAHVPVDFRSSSVDPDGLIVNTLWDFGDGSGPGRDTSVTHVFPRRGEYNVTVTVTDNLLATSSLTRSVNISNSAPVVDFTATPDPTFRNVPVTFQDSTTDPDGDGLQDRQWNFGDGTPAVLGGTTMTHTYTTLGQKVVTLRVKDGKGVEGFASRAIQVLNKPPTGAFSWDPAIPIADQPFTVTATGVDLDSPGGLTYRWVLPAGATAEGQSVELTLPPGSHVIQLVIVDGDGGRSPPIRRTVLVEPAPLIASFTWTPAAPNTGEPVTFRDATITPNGAIVERAWSVADTGFTSGARNATFIFEQGKTYFVTLRVRDASGQIAYAFNNVTVNARPTAFFEVPVGVLTLGEPITFTDRSVDPERSEMSYLWDFGDGSTSAQKGNATHTFTTPGPKTVNLTVTDDKGASHFVERNINLLNRRPVARWDLLTPLPTVHAPVAFQSTGRAYDPDGPNMLQSWAWSFGDGGASALADPTHTFTRSGVYTVSLQVGDGELRSLSEAGSYRVLRVGADHEVRVTLIARLPDNRTADLLDDRFQISTRFGQPGVGYQAFPKAAYAPNGTALDLVLDAGRWAQGDQVHVDLLDASFMDVPLRRLATLRESDGLTTSVTIIFDIPLPLVATVDPTHGDDTIDPASGALANRTQTADGEPIYRSPFEDFHGEGAVAFIDGVPVHKAQVTLYARYVPLAAVATAQETADLGNLGGMGLLGWCRAASALTRVDGTYSWAFAGGDCIGSAAGVYPVGRWEVKALATYNTATSDESDAAHVWVDPTGGALADLPLP